MAGAVKGNGSDDRYTYRHPFGSDHANFYRVGLPGFMFIQDPLDYSRTWHSNMDLYDRLQEEDMKQAAAVVASFIYQAALREELLPSKSL